jgi:hypothetical protein
MRNDKFQKNFLRQFNIKIPICVDLDGTLISEDTTIESLRNLFHKSKYDFIKCVVHIYKGIKSIKSHLPENNFLINKININTTLLTILKDEITRGRNIVLATAANKHQGQEALSYIPIFDGVIGSNTFTNIRAKQKSIVLMKKFKKTGFIYVGNSFDDIQVWIWSHAGICVNIKQKYVLKEIMLLNIPYIIL